MSPAPRKPDPTAPLDLVRLIRLVRGLLAAGTPVRFRVGGNSMRPFVRDGDIATVVPVPAPNGIKAGDIVLFLRPGGGMVAHRVLKIRGGAKRPVLEVRGDAHAGPREQVEARRVMGRLVAVQRGGKDLALAGPRHRLMGKLWGRCRPLAVLLPPRARRVIRGMIG